VTPKLTSHQIYYLRLKLSGLCITCGEPVAAHRYCRVHLLADNARRRANWAKGPKRRSDDRNDEARRRARDKQRSRRAAR
jgi:hypothetical protein